MIDLILSGRVFQSISPGDQGQSLAIWPLAPGQGGYSRSTKIAEYVEATHGITITTAHVSAIKASLKERKGGGKKKGRKQGTKAPAAVAATPATASRTSASNGLSPQDLAELAGLAEKAGSVGRLREYVDVLSSVR